MCLDHVCSMTEERPTVPSPLAREISIPIPWDMSTGGMTGASIKMTSDAAI